MSRRRSIGTEGHLDAARCRVAEALGLIRFTYRLLRRLVTTSAAHVRIGTRTFTPEKSETEPYLDTRKSKRSIKLTSHLKCYFYSESISCLKRGVAHLDAAQCRVEKTPASTCVAISRRSGGTSFNTGRSEKSIKFPTHLKLYFLSESSSKSVLSSRNLES